MSRNELIDAYRRGRISRRMFIKGMTAVGVSAVAARKLADDLRAAPAPRSGRGAVAFQDDVYPTPTPDDVYPTVAPTAAPPAPTAAATQAPQAPTALPSTGVGDDDSGSSLWKPIAVAGAAAAAFVASRLRKIRGAETE